jgi:hypothetical protein
MNEFPDSSEYSQHEGWFDFEADLPEPLDHWTLRDFADIVPIVRYAS